MKLKNIFILILTFCIKIIVAQPYNFTKTSGTYSELTNAINLNGSTIWSGFLTYPNIPLGFSFPFMDSSFSSIDYEVTGRVIFDNNHYYFADLFTCQGLKDKGTASTVSPISYQTIGNSPNKIFKLQIKNASLASSSMANINFQIWIHENGDIALHMGPNSGVGQAGAFSSGGPYSGVFQVTSWSPLRYKYGTVIYQNPSNPKDSIFNNSPINVSAYELDYAPIDGTIYTFSEKNLSINSYYYNEQPIIYPNPTSKILYLKNINGDEKFFLYNSLGELVKYDELTSNNFIDISNLNKGIYYFLIKNDNYSYSSKLIIE